MKNQTETKKWFKRVLAALGIILLVLVIVDAITLYNPVKTVMSAQQVDDGYASIGSAPCVT